MAGSRKLANFRQFSFDCSGKREMGAARTAERPHPVKIAWGEEPDGEQKEEGLVAKKCVTEKKPVVKLTRHSSLEKESILYSKHDMIERLTLDRKPKPVKKPLKLTKQNSMEKESLLLSKEELADRFRQALKDGEQSRFNLNIFLAHNTNSEEEVYEPDSFSKDSQKITPPPLDLTESLFQIRKNYHMARTNAIVVIPSANEENSSNDDNDNSPLLDSPSSEHSLGKDSKAIKDVIIRPITAASKRERFQKKSNTAFHSTIKEGVRGPLIRSSSAPAKPEQHKSKFLATKRKVKSGKLRPEKFRGKDSESDKEETKNQKELNKYVAISGTDIVTMVSLVSPAASDTEEIETELKPKSSPVKSKPPKPEEREPSRHLSLRKTVKSVSFQSSTIHAVRSFSASFPARRSSMALPSFSPANNINSQKSLEKRAPTVVSEEADEREPKRRLVGNVNDTTSTSDAEENSEAIKPIQNKDTENPENVIEEEKIVEKENEKSQNKEDKPSFGSLKEKECWQLYCKMVEKGLKVSYETILRGMLTPTEYRMRKKVMSNE